MIGENHTMIFDKIIDFSHNSHGKSLKARVLIFWILPIYLHILIPVKTEFAKHIDIVVFMDK